MRRPTTEIWFTTSERMENELQSSKIRDHAKYSHPGKRSQTRVRNRLTSLMVTNWKKQITRTWPTWRWSCHSTSTRPK